MIARDLEPEDFPFSIYIWRGDVEDLDAAGLAVAAGLVLALQVWNVEWAVTVLPPPPGFRVPLYIPSFADVAPVFVTTRSATGAVATTGPYETPAFGRG